MSGPVVASLVGAVLLACLHIASPVHEHWRSRPRHWLLTLASGAAVGFVLTRLVPTIVADAPSVARVTGLDTDQGVQLVLSLMLLSVVSVFGLDRLVKHSRRRRSEAEGRTPPAGLGAFTVALAAYALMNLGVGYLVREQAAQGYAAVFLLVVAKGFAFLVLDHAYLEDQGEKYGKLGRWVVAAADLLGWALALVVQLPAVVPTLFLAVLGGAILLNTLKEETPPGRQAMALPFASGATLYTALAWSLG